MQLNTIKEVEQALEPLAAAALAATGRDITTQRTFALANLVGNPQDKLRVVHVAGTSGKTSTSYYIAGMLQRAGAKTGLTVSPHINSITDRVQVGGQSLSNAAFCQYMSEFLPQVLGDGSDLPSYFEVMMVFALWVFVREGVDYAVVETGLGGLHDSSNICRQADKLCVITDIGIDHTQVLGGTLPAIAAQKAGIIAPGNVAVMHQQGAAVMRVLRRRAKQQNAQLVELPPQNYAEYQDRNFALALAAYAQLVQRDGLAVLGDAELNRVRQLQVPGRLEITQQGSATVIIDGAHNQQKIQALIKTLQAKYPGQKWAVVLAMRANKDYQAVVKLLAPITSQAVAIQFNLGQDTPIVALAPEVLAKEFAIYDVGCAASDSSAAVLGQLAGQGQQHILVTGSLYLAAEARRVVRKN